MNTTELRILAAEKLYYYSGEWAGFDWYMWLKYPKMSKEEKMKFERTPCYQDLKDLKLL